MNPIHQMIEDDDKLKCILEAMQGERGADQERIARATIDWLDLLLRKNKDYGSSAWKAPYLIEGMDPKAAMLVRMSDKIERLRSLYGKDPEVVGESFDDTIRDLGAYCLLYLAAPTSKAKDTEKGKTVF